MHSRLLPTWIWSTAIYNLFNVFCKKFSRGNLFLLVVKLVSFWPEKAKRKQATCSEKEKKLIITHISIKLPKGGLGSSLLWRAWLREHERRVIYLMRTSRRTRWKLRKFPCFMKTSHHKKTPTLLRVIFLCQFNLKNDAPQNSVLNRSETWITLKRQIREKVFCKTYALMFSALYIQISRGRTWEIRLISRGEN